MKISKNKQLIRYLLEKEGIIVPSGIFKIRTVEELEKRLSKGNPYLLYKFYEELAKKLPEVVEIQKLKNMFEFARELKEKYGNKLTEDDEKIIRFFVENSEMQTEDFMELIGPMYYLMRVMDDFNKKQINSKFLKMFIFTSAYVQIYELLLYQMDRRLFNYLKHSELKHDKLIKKFMEFKRENLQHTQAWEINRVLSKLLGIDPENNSIIGGGTPKIIRNNISHANLFYDPEEDIVFVGNKKFSVDQFIGEYYRLLVFCLRWLELSVGMDLKDNPLELILAQLSRNLREIAKVFLRIERSEYKKVFGAMVIQWKKEMQN